MSHRGKLSIVILGLAVAGGALRPSSAIAKKWYEYTDSEIIPPAKTTPDNRTFIVIGFSYKGRYFTNNKKYVWRKHTSRGSAITNWKQWKRDGLGVHITWSTRGFGQTADIEKKAKDIYYAKYAAKYSKSPTPRPTAPSAASVAGTKWYNRQDAEAPYWWFSKNGRLEVGDIKGLTSNDRGTWTQSGNKVTTNLRGYKETWTINGSRMSTRFKSLKKL